MISDGDKSDSVANNGQYWLITVRCCTHWLYSRGKGRSFLCRNHQYWIVNGIKCVLVTSNYKQIVLNAIVG